MIFLTKDPSSAASRLVKNYWYADSEGESDMHEQKIVPDGYPEIIIHFGDPYMVNLSGNWEQQKKNLLAGQIRKFFYLKNTGRSSMFGIKLQPAAISLLYKQDMSQLVDLVVSLDESRVQHLLSVAPPINQDNFESVIETFDVHISSLIDEMDAPSNEEKALCEMIAKNGTVYLAELYDKFDTNERKLERYFKHYVGLSPKFYCRILRFAQIFKLVDQKKRNWTEITYLAGFYDQAHFIKNFKEFTGEEPSKYGFSEKTMANFFLKP